LQVGTIHSYVLAGALALRSRLQTTGYRLQATGYRLQATGYRLQATGYRLQWGRGCQWQTEHPSDVAAAAIVCCAVLDVQAALPLSALPFLRSPSFHKVHSHSHGTHCSDEEDPEMTLPCPRHGGQGVAAGKGNGNGNSNSKEETKLRSRLHPNSPTHPLTHSLSSVSTLSLTHLTGCVKCRPHKGSRLKGS
jgi:hypothetical protein